MQPVLDALNDQRRELDGILSGLDDGKWSMLTPRCPGWTVADVVLHLAQTDEAAVASAAGQLTVLADFTGAGETIKVVDDFAALAVANERGAPPADVYARWRKGAAAQWESLAACEPGRRLRWVAGEMAARTLASTRLSECWIHTGDIADALGVALAPTDRLWHIARLAWRTLPYAFARGDRTLLGPVALRLTAPDGDSWSFGEDADAPTTVTGPALDFCLVAGQRLEASASALVAEGPDAAAVLELVRTFA